MKKCPDCRWHSCIKAGVCQNETRPQRANVVPALPESVGFTYNNADKISKEKRMEILSAAGFRCVVCNELGTFESLTLDHIIPKAKGGTNRKRNLQCMCRECNQMKADRLLTIKELKQIRRLIKK